MLGPCGLRRGGALEGGGELAASVAEVVLGFAALVRPNVMTSILADKLVESVLELALLALRVHLREVGVGQAEIPTVLIEQFDHLLNHRLLAHHPPLMAEEISARRRRAAFIGKPP
jgi:hypothetical protein